MRIALDARWIFEEISGVGAYMSALIEHLARIDRENEYVLLFTEARLMDRTAERTRYGAAPNIEPHLLPQGVFSLGSQRTLPRFLSDQGVDVYHAPNYFIPFRPFPRQGPRRTRCIVNVHDVIPLVMPRAAPRSRKRKLFPIYRRIMREVGARADAIITGSRCSRDDILEHLAIPDERADRVVTIPNGVAERFKPPSREGPSEPPTILYVGRRDPYKNLTGLVEAFALLIERGLDDIALRVVGPPDKRYPEANRMVEALGLTPRVTWVDYVEDDDLVREYQRAAVYVHPSRYEGFGLPVLEAMACGTPVVCSNRSSLPEVAGDAALLIDPDDAPAMADAVTSILHDPTVARGLREKGLAHTETFSWTRTARRTLDLYHSLQPQPESGE